MKTNLIRVLVLSALAATAAFAQPAEAARTQAQRGSAPAPIVGIWDVAVTVVNCQTGASIRNVHSVQMYQPDGAFSVLGLVWRPGQTTRIHDHITWCVVGVLSGVEHEELFDDALNPIGVRDNPPGEVSGFAPPGDIHRIRNVSDETAISLHVYGTDISRVGSSARRFYN